MNLIKCEKLEKSMAELQFSIDAEAFTTLRPTGARMYLFSPSAYWIRAI